MDKALFKPSQLDEAIQARLSRHLQPVLDDHPALGLKVIFRQGGSLGPNAFALPAGTVIFTDEMVALAQDDDELVAVLAHEIGHVAHRHAMRTLIQDSMLAFGVMALTGDVAGTSEVFIGLPVFLTEMYYSREFEFEADGYALAYMRKKGIKTAHFANLMHRLEQKVSGGKAAQESKITSYLSTHPRMQERLRPFEGSR
jgi:Zn-dependent protease with chaperone function